MLGTSDSHAYNLVPRIPGSFKLRDRWRVTVADVEAWIASLKAEQDERRNAGKRWAAGFEARRRSAKRAPVATDAPDPYAIRIVPSRQSLNRERAARKARTP